MAFPVAELTYNIPSVSLDLGTWSPEVMKIPSTGTGSEPVHWQRTIEIGGMEAGAAPTITLDMEDADLAEATKLQFYENEVAEENLLDEGVGGESATTNLKEDQKQIIAVVKIPEDRLRALGIGDNHCLSGGLTIDPNGTQIEYIGDPEQVDEPASQDCSIRARVYQPFDPWPYIQIALGGLGILAAAIAAFALLPAVPRRAAIQFDGNPPVPIARGSTVGGGGHTVDIGAVGYVGQIKGQLLGRLTRSIKFVTAQDVTYNGNTLVAAGKSVVMNPGDRIEPVDGSEFTYV